MEVRVLFFGILRELAGSSRDTLTVSDSALLSDVLAHYEKRFPKLKDLLPSIAMSVNREYAGPEARLHPDDEIALLPPVSGGAGKSSKESSSLLMERLSYSTELCATIPAGGVLGTSTTRRTRRWRSPR